LKIIGIYYLTVAAWRWFHWCCSPWECHCCSRPWRSSQILSHLSL